MCLIYICLGYVNVGLGLCFMFICRLGLGYVYVRVGSMVGLGLRLGLFSVRFMACHADDRFMLRLGLGLGSGLCLG